MARFSFTWGNGTGELYKVGTICSIRFLNNKDKVYEQHNLIIETLRRSTAVDKITARMTDKWAEGGKCIITIRKRRGMVVGVKNLDHVGLSKRQHTEMLLNIMLKSDASDEKDADTNFLRDMHMEVLDKAVATEA